jgi:hypothetical protein
MDIRPRDACCLMCLDLCNKVALKQSININAVNLRFESPSFVILPDIIPTTVINLEANNSLKTTGQ